MTPGEFWASVGGGENAETFESLAAVVRASDLIAVGSIKEVRDGRRIFFPETGETTYQAEVRVQVDEILHGTLTSPTDDPGTVVVEASLGFGPNPSRLAALQANAPVGKPVVLFLLNINADSARHGFGADRPYLGEIYYFALNGIQDAIWDDGEATAIGPGGEAWPWLTKLRGQPFERVVRDIRATAAAEPGVPAGAAPPPPFDFWGELFAVRDPAYRSLADVGARSEAIVVGSFTGDVEPGREPCDAESLANGAPRSQACVFFVNLPFRIDELLAGTLPEAYRETVKLEIVRDVPILDIMPEG